MFLLKENPDRNTYHTVQVDRNGLAHCLFAGLRMKGGAMNTSVRWLTSFGLSDDICGSLEALAWLCLPARTVTSLNIF